MKLSITCVAFVAICASYAIHTAPEDNHERAGESRFIMPILVDARKKRSGASNKYWLFTRSNPNTAQIIISGCVKCIRESNYLESRPLKIIVHGWNNNATSPMNPIITSAFLTVQDCNVIVVDWSDVANLKYIAASAEVPKVGTFIGNFLIWLMNTTGGDWNNIHMVGFSLGAHVVGVAGRQTGGRPARITGLDPAGPCWDNNSNALNTDAGQYVEVIHTDGNRLGLFNPVGHADFYPNGGKNPQPGCWLSSCSHGRATRLFASTVQFDHLVGNRCQNITEVQLGDCSGETLNMGNSVISKRGTGLYSLKTGDEWPY